MGKKKKEVEALERDTVDLFKMGYAALRASLSDRQAAQQLEAWLSQRIVETEQLILDHKLTTHLNQAYRRRRAILKRVADGLAWKFFGFDEHLLKIYSLKQNPGYMAGKDGYAGERRFVDLLFRLPFVDFVIQNDITNILRKDDVTFLVNGCIRSYEVKLSKRTPTPRELRQSQRSATIDSFLIEGFTNSEHLLTPGTDTRRTIELPWKNDYYWEQLDKLVTQALETDIAWEVIDDAEIIFCYKPRVEDQELATALAAAVISTGWSVVEFSFGSLMRQFDPLDDDILRYIIPITAFELEPATLERIVSGEIEVLVWVNIHQLKQAFAARGLEVEIEEGHVRFARESREVNGLHIDIEGTCGRRIWNSLVYGLLTVPSFVENVITIHALTKKESYRHLDVLREGELT